jgi:ABC-2 type transport system permease protein
VRKIGHIAAREFVATAGTRGFIVGLLVAPALMAVFALAAPRLFNQRGFVVQGQVAIIDPTGVVAPALHDSVDPVRVAARREEETRRALAAAPGAFRELAETGTAPTAAANTVMGQPPELTILTRDPGADLQREKAWLSEQPRNGPRHLALVVVHADAVVPQAAGTAYGTYDLYVPPGLDDRIESAVIQNVREAIVSSRLRAKNLDRGALATLMRVDRVQSVTVMAGNERQTVRAFNRILPFAFAFLMFLGVMLGGQTLLTNTVEEKTSRVVEVLLSAVSPIELMAGKILGQMGVSLVALALYVALGMALLTSFTLFGLLDPWLLFYLIVFFVITYLLIGSLMTAIGAAVNEMQEAQSLMGPIMIVLMIPWLLVMPISLNPNSRFSVVMSFMPPFNTFAMLTRMSSTAPPPLWQVWLTIVIGIGSALAAIWFAAKVFRIGLLMYGKPPNFATLIRWARSA